MFDPLWICGCDAQVYGTADIVGVGKTKKRMGCSQSAAGVKGPSLEQKQDGQSPIPSVFSLDARTQPKDAWYVLQECVLEVVMSCARLRCHLVYTCSSGVYSLWESRSRSRIDSWERLPIDLGRVGWIIAGNITQHGSTHK